VPDTGRVHKGRRCRLRRRRPLRPGLESDPREVIMAPAQVAREPDFAREWSSREFFQTLLKV
jgi:hypothetical protein